MLLPSEYVEILSYMGRILTELMFSQDRVQLLAALIPLIPNGSLHVLPSLLPEAVLATKEVSEKARNGAFDLLVAMGRRMEQGGTVDRGKVDGMEVEDEGEALASGELHCQACVVVWYSDMP